MTRKRGKFIVLLGVNGTGKSTQAQLLAEKIRTEAGNEVKYVKYPIYGLEPTGPMINSYLREGNPHKFSSREFQILHAFNRTAFEPRLTEFFESGVHVVAEDYVETSLAWGIAKGVEKKFLLELNSHLLEPDIRVFFNGRPYGTDREKNHLHESNMKLVERVFKEHQRLAKEFKWKTIDLYDEEKEPFGEAEIHERVWGLIDKSLDL